MGVTTMKDLMLDIETMGNRSTSAIVQIGACYFNRHTGEIGDTFLENVSLEISMSLGLTVDASTIQWWMKQKNKSWLDGKCGLIEALCKFIDFSKNVKYIWSHSTFDIPILFNAYNITGYKIPFHYRQTRDIRTLTHLAGHQRNESTIDPNDKTHNALDDCVYQVKYCVECFNKLSTENRKE